MNHVHAVKKITKLKHVAAAPMRANALRNVNVVIAAKTQIAAKTWLNCASNHLGGLTYNIPSLTIHPLIYST